MNARRNAGAERHGRTAQGSRTAHFARVGVALAVLALAVAALTGCSLLGGTSGSSGASTGASTTAASQTATFPLTITDDASRVVTFAAAPQRIVSLAPANTEIVYSLGLFKRIVGVTTYDDYPAQVKGVAKMGDFQTPNLEAIAAANPDVVLVTGGVQADVISKLEAIGAKVVVVDPQSLNGVFSSIQTVGDILGVPAKATSVVAGMQKELTYIRAAVSAEPTVTAFVEIGWNPLYTAGPGTLLDDLLTAAGGANVVTQKGYVGHSVEQLVKDQPSVYLGTVSSIGSTWTVAGRPGYSALSAVKDGKVFALADDLVSRPGPRVIQGVLEMAMALHPYVFAK
jgi:iron complex transport system substrate-binding protein